MSDNTEIIGKKLYSFSENKPYAAFWRIPYAEKPIKDLRFKPPQQTNAWTNNTVLCDFSNLYNETRASENTEDCLYLSIYKPLYENESNKYPILIWLHENSNNLGPDFFIDERLIVVTISYRTSILGFLNTGDEFAEGNMGAKDVLMALKWVKNNIRSFDGDPSNVTVCGWGASANIAAALLVSKPAEGLFTRVIVQSGSALAPDDYKSYSFEIVNKLYSRLNGPHKFNRKRLCEMLMDSSIIDLKMAAHELFDSTEVRDTQRPINAFGPTVETSKQAFMNKLPAEVYKRNTANKVDVMIGYTSLESFYKLKGFVGNRMLLKYLNYNFQYLLPFEGLADEYGSRRYNVIRERIMDFYFVNGTVGERSLRRYVKYVSDQVIYPLLRQARLHADASSNNVYLYRFSYNGALNSVWESSVGRVDFSGATHGDEICYLFRCKSNSHVEPSTEISFIKKIVRLWANFVKRGNPTPSKDDVLDNLIWEPLSTKPMRAMSLGRKFKMIKIPEQKRMKFWDELRDEFFVERPS